MEAEVCFSHTLIPPSGGWPCPSHLDPLWLPPWASTKYLALGRLLPKATSRAAGAGLGLPANAISMKRPSPLSFSLKPILLHKQLHFTSIYFFQFLKINFFSWSISQSLLFFFPQPKNLPFILFFKFIYLF